MEPVALVYRERWGMWWAELWVDAKDPKWAWSNNPLLRRQNPPRPVGMDREGLSLHKTRRSAARSASEMKARYLAGHPVALDEEVIATEVVA